MKNCSEKAGSIRTCIRASLPECRIGRNIERFCAMREKREVVVDCLTLGYVYEDYPFHDDKWCVMRHKASKKTFAYIYEKNDQIWVNVKCEPQWRDFWRSTFEAVVPGYHMNKEHWNSIILDGTIPKRDIKRMIAESYDLTKGKKDAENSRMD